MILQALGSYYDRLADLPGSTLPADGFSAEKIHFSLVLSVYGDLLQVLDLRQPSGKRQVPRMLNVPQGSKKSINIAANFLWGNTSYVLGADEKGKPERTALCQEAFSRLHEELLGTSNDDGARAVLAFMNKWKPSHARELPDWSDLVKSNIVFKLNGDRTFVHDRPAMRRAWEDHVAGRSASSAGMCLVSGEVGPVARLHAAIKGVRGAQSSGAALVSFNLDAFCSYGKDQNYNAPVSEDRAAAYTKALNDLISSSRHRILIGEATTVFWTERESPIEGVFGLLLDPHEAAASDDQALAVFLEAITQGKLPPGYDPDVRFFILGLSPNASRLAVRFWYVGTVRDISEHLGRHFRDLAIVRSFDHDPPHPGMWRLLLETKNRKSSDPPAPLLAGAVMRSILTGTLYPQALLTAVIGRIRAEQSVTYLRAAIIKAVLTRKQRILNQGTEVPVALDKDNSNPAYLMGRLFAVLEKAQKDAIPGANTTIKDRFYGSASTTPRMVFPQLLRLAQHHIQKAEYGGFRDKQIEEIMGEIQDFPAHLAVDQQGLFAIGYYHQRQDFFKKTESK